MRHLTWTAFYELTPELAALPEDQLWGNAEKHRVEQQSALLRAVGISTPLAVDVDAGLL